MSTDETRPPGPDGLPVVGDTLDLSRDALGFYEHLRDEYGRIASYRVFGTETCMVADPEAVRSVLLADHDAYTKGEVITRSLSDAMAEGLFVTDGERWERQRTGVQPAFYRERLATYLPAMCETAAATVDGWSDGDTVAVDEAMTDTTAAVLGRTLFGVDVADEPVVASASEALLDRFDTSRVSSFLPPWIPTRTNRRYRRELDRLRGFVDDLVERRRARPPAERDDDLLSILVTLAEAGDLETAELRDNAITFLFAGHGTTALGLTYTLLCLAREPDEQARVREEVDRVLDGPPTAEDLPELARTGRAIDEALRLYPPVYMFFREPTRDVELGGYEIPEGTTLVLPQWAVHRDPEIWDAPGEFRPDRFAGDPDRPEYAHFPFGGGPRACIGMRFALMEAKVVLATVLREFELELVSDPEPELIASSNLQPAEPVEVRVRRRSGQTDEPVAGSVRGD